MSEMNLGRIPDPDARDRNYPMTTVLPARTSRTWRYWYANGAWWDQGATGTCVGHAWGHYVEDGPITHDGQTNVVDPIDIYLACTLIDPWPQNDNGDLQFGTSTRSGAQVLHQRGFISEYRWAWDLDTVVMAVLESGPVVVGTDWYFDMFTPDDEDIVYIGGGVAGGHAYVLNGVNTKRGLFRLKNSWGRGWGNNGHAWIPIDDIGQLVSQQGEAVIALERSSN